MLRKVTTTVYLTMEQDRKLKEISKQTDVPVAVLIRRGIDLEIERQHREKRLNRFKTVGITGDGHD